MGKATVEVLEIRFIIKPEVTEAYVLYQGHGDVPHIGVTGWHHKTFPKSISVMDILKLDQTKENSLMWDMGAPE